MKLIDFILLFIVGIIVFFALRAALSGRSCCGTDNGCRSCDGNCSHCRK